MVQFDIINFVGIRCDFLFQEKKTLRVSKKNKWLILSIGGLLLIGFGLSLLGESIIKKYENHPNWFYWGTLALVVFNSGICIVIKASSIKSKS